MRQGVQAAADAWETKGRDSSELYRRGKLEQALTWQRTAAQRGEVRDIDRLFLEASAKSQSTSTRFRRAGVIALAVLLVAAIVAARQADVEARHANVEARDASTQASLARRAAQVAKRQAELAEQQARIATAGQIATQSEGLDEYDIGKADVLAAAAFAFDPDQLSTDALADALQRPRQLVLQAHTAAVTGVAFADDGKEVVTVGDDGDAYLWDTASGAMAAGPMEGYQVAPVVGPVVSPDGKTVATALGNYVYLWSIFGGQVGGTDGGPPYVSECLDDVTALAFSPDGRYLAVACPDGGPADPTNAVSLNPLIPSAAKREISTGAAASAVGFSPDGRMLAAVTGDQVQLFTVATGASGPVLSGDTGAVTALAFSPDGKTLVTASRDGTARLWNAATGPQEALLQAGGGAVTAVAFSPDGSAVATASTDGTARLWNATSGAVTATLTGHAGAVTAVAFDPKKPIVVTAGADRTARIWNARTGTEIAVLRGDTGAINAIAISPDGQTLATASNDTTARLWNLTFVAPDTVLTTGSSTVTSLAFSANGKTVAATGHDGIVRVWNTTGAPERTYNGRDGSLLGMTFDANGNVAATNGTVTEVWKPDFTAPATVPFTPNGYAVNTDQEAMTNTCHCLSAAARAALVADATGGAFAISPDGSRYADGNGLYDTATSKMIDTLGGFDPDKEWTSVAFSPDGSRIVVGNEDGTIWLYNGVTGHLLAQRSGTSPVLAAAFDPKGRTLATADADGTIQLWNAATATPIGRLTGAVGAVTHLAFSPDGETLASGGADGTVRLWNAITGTRSPPSPALDPSPHSPSALMAC